jgi:hypothetical protein
MAFKIDIKDGLDSPTKQDCITLQLQPITKLKSKRLQAIVMMNKQTSYNFLDTKSSSTNP